MIVATEARTTVTTYGKLGHVALAVVIAHTCEERSQLVLIGRSATRVLLAVGTHTRRGVDIRTCQIGNIVTTGTEIGSMTGHGALSEHGINMVITESAVESQGVIHLPYGTAA